MKYFLTLAASSFILTACLSAPAPNHTDAEKEALNDLNTSNFQPATRELRDNIETQELLTQATFWSHEYGLNPADLEAAIKFSAALRRLGNPSKAVEITRTTRALHPKDPYLNAEHAAALIEDQQFKPAIKILDQTLRTTPNYARLWSLKGVALDQQEQYETARPLYLRALKITPNDPKIMSNIGLNFALSGDAKTAHHWLSRAAAHPDAPESAEANLELVEDILAEQASKAQPPVHNTARNTTQSLSTYESQTIPKTYPQAAAPNMRQTSQTLPAAPYASTPAPYKAPSQPIAQAPIAPPIIKQQPSPQNPHNLPITTRQAEAAILSQIAKTNANKHAIARQAQQNYMRQQQYLAQQRHYQARLNAQQHAAAQYPQGQGQAQTLNPTYPQHAPYAQRKIQGQAQQPQLQYAPYAQYNNTQQAHSTGTQAYGQPQYGTSPYYASPQAQRPQNAPILGAARRRG